MAKLLINEKGSLFNRGNIQLAIIVYLLNAIKDFKTCEQI